MAYWLSTGLWPASLCSCVCDSCRASHGSASGDAPCPHQQGVFGIPHQESFDQANFQSPDAGAGAGGLLAYTGAFDQDPYSQPSSYPQSITNDLNPPDGNPWLQDQPGDVSSNYVLDTTESNRPATGQNGYSKNQQHVNHPNGTDINNHYRAAQVSDAGSSSEARNGDDRVVTNNSRSRSSRHQRTMNRLKHVQKVIRDAETSLDNRRRHNSS